MSVSLRVGQFQTALRFSFKHASATRSATDNVIVQLTDPNGLTGYGEGCPREYVTGETTQSCMAFLNRYGQAIASEVSSVDTLKLWINNNNELINSNPSAFCAIETAWLDLLARQRQLPIEALLNLPPPIAPINYTAVMGNSSPAKMRLMTWAYQLIGFSDFKIKLSGDPTLDAKRLSVLPTRSTVRLDANNLWDSAADCINSCKQLKRPFHAIEEPVNAFDTNSMQNIAEALDCKIILDESLFNKEHLALLKNHDTTRFIGNIRVSKCGGILRAIELAKLCQASGVGVIIGAHVGETSLLTRAAICVGQGLPQAPLAREGAYGNILLKQDISSHSLHFTKNGIIDPSKQTLFKDPGFGLSVVPTRINWHHY